MQSQTSRQKEDETIHVVKIISNARSPTLETVRRVEEIINKYSGKYTQREIWQKLPRKVMWQTYKLIIDYLQDINKIVIDNEDKVVYIWDPKMVKKYSSRIQNNKPYKSKTTNIINIIPGDLRVA